MGRNKFSKNGMSTKIIKKCNFCNMTFLVFNCRKLAKYCSMDCRDNSYRINSPLKGRLFSDDKKEK